MGKLVFLHNNQPVTDSLTVAEVFEKRHDIVLRDIENQITKLQEAGEQEFSLHNFEESTYTNERGREYRKYNLTEDAFTLVSMAYTTPEAMKFKVRFIREFKRMREQLAEMNKPSYMIDDPIERAKKWIEEQQEKKKLQTDKLVLTQQVNELQPKASYYDLILQNKNLIPISVIAKDYGMSAKTMNKKLHELGVQYKQGDIWLLYAKYQDKGYTQTTTHAIDADKSKPHTKWTQKGRKFIYDLLKSEGILPIIERDQEGEAS
ncbi:Rha family transcriptional regulator [Heyndrickxia coagulans]|uniref:Rha family transcriptional regulator n=2 Tax=Bacillota TaxID=1239 RepID=UPI0014516C36|nr:phage antirepressor KilAC domain-containing protein [Heyndrickxia coagulans]MED4495571.1 phage antirepressor KilAC domain-containing protein [Heyndrickxia coagulans]MED4534980.1 phage antirepressor KilAC domain-containing protein [Heyndrickxia coagulans]QJE31828.1 Rha family transcriptional regulator [Heyndrickxia coagulans]